MKGAKPKAKTKPIRCLCCGELVQGKGKSSREHAIADWLIQAWALTQETISDFIAGPNAVSLVKTRPLSAVKEKKFCPKCNNRWMSRLEEKMKPIFLAFSQGGQIEPCNLTKEQRIVIARWVAKTAIVLSHAVQSKQMIDPKYLREMRDNEHDGPHGVAVFIAKMTFDGAPRIMWAKTDGASEMFVGDGEHAAAPKVGILLGDVLLIAAFPLPGEWKMRIADNLYAPIWPQAKFESNSVTLPTIVAIEQVIKMVLDTIEIAFVHRKTGAVLVPVGVVKKKQ